MLNYQRVSDSCSYWCVLNVGLLDGLLGVAGMIVDSSPVDHSRKFPAFSTSKFKPHMIYMFHEFLRMSSCSASILILSFHVSRFLVDMHTLCCLTSPIFLLPNIQQIIDLCGVPHLSWQTIRVFQSLSSLSLRHFSHHFFMVSFW